MKLYLVLLLSLIGSFILFHYCYEIIDIDYEVLFIDFSQQLKIIQSITRNFTYFETPATIKKPFPDLKIDFLIKKTKMTNYYYEEEIIYKSNGINLIKILLMVSISLLITAFFFITLKIAKLDSFLVKKSIDTRLILKHNLQEYERKKLKLSRSVFGELSKVVKIKKILCIVIFLSLIDTLSRKALEISNGFYYNFFLQIIIILEMGISIYLIRIYASLLFNQCYNKSIAYIDDGNFSIESLNSLKSHIIFTNKKGIGVIIHMFYYSIFSYFLYALFVSKSNYSLHIHDMVNHKDDNAYIFKKRFSETVFYCLAMGLFFCKSVVYNIYFYYHFYYLKDKNLL